MKRAYPNTCAAKQIKEETDPADKDRRKRSYQIDFGNSRLGLVEIHYLHAGHPFTARHRASARTEASMADNRISLLVSPERELFNGEVDHVVVPGSEGEFGVSPNHAPVMAVIVSAQDHERRRHAQDLLATAAADVTPEGLTVLAEEVD